MNLQDLSLEQLKEIKDGAPDKTADYFIADRSAREYYSLEFGSCFSSELGEWEDSDFRTEGELKNIYRHVLNLSDIRAQIEKIEAQKDTNVTLSAGSIENKGVDGSEKPVFKVGDRVVPESEATNLIRAVREVLEVDGDQIRYHMEAQVRSYWSKAKGWRHATPAEIATGHRIDESQLDAQFVKQALGSTIYTKEYMDSLHPFDCEQCRQDAQATLERIYMILCPDCGNKRCPQAQNHRYKCTGSNAVNQAGELKEQPDSITAQLDPAKCRVVDPTVYDAPTSRRVGWIGCKGAIASDKEIFANVAIHNALHGLSSTPKIDCNHTPFNFGLADAQGNRDCITCGKRLTRHEVDAAWLALARNAPTDSPRDDFGAMSESHRSPSCKCHEWPLDVQIKPNAEDESMGLNPGQSQILVDQANEIIGLNKQVNTLNTNINVALEIINSADTCMPFYEFAGLLEQALKGGQAK